MKTINNYIHEKLIITKDTKEKHNKFYEFTKYPEVNKILTICGFNDSVNKPNKEIINIIREALFEIKQKLNEEIYALVDKYTYNLLDNKYHISKYKNYIIIDDQKYNKFYDDRFIRVSGEYCISSDYSIYVYDYYNKYEDNRILYYDTRNPDEKINVFFIKKSKN